MATERVQRRLAAILAADVAGYSRLMGANEVGTLTALKALRREVVDPAIAEHGGRIVKTTGDGILVEFASAVDAVNCAVGVQSKIVDRQGEAAQRIMFRIGINVGDIIIDGDDIFGDGVNIAARIENECEPGNVYLSGSAFEQVRGKTSFAFDDLGEKSLKNIDRPVRLFAARTAAALIIARLPLVSLHALHHEVGDAIRSTFDASPLNCLVVVPAPKAHFSALESDDDLVCRNVAVAAYAHRGSYQLHDHLL